MNDLELTKLCAEAMALVKRFLLDCDYDEGIWGVIQHESPYGRAAKADLNRAIVSCVAKMQREKSK